MVRTTRKQREALATVYSRRMERESNQLRRSKDDARWLKGYREFRKTVQPCFDSSGCIMVKWAGMWLGIEQDGYTHS